MRARGGWQLQSGMIELLNLAPAVRIHGSSVLLIPPPIQRDGLSAAGSMNHFARQPGFRHAPVPDDGPRRDLKDTAISSKFRPAKKRSSTICAFRWSNLASSSRASSSFKTWASRPGEAIARSSNEILLAKPPRFAVPLAIAWLTSIRRIICAESAKK